MKKLIFTLGIISIFAFASVVMAVPVLQLDISDGWYDQPSESIVTAAGDFTLYALLTPNGEGSEFSGDSSSLIYDDYILSIAIYPAPEDGGIFGDFILDDSTIQADDTWDYGYPPIEVDGAEKDGGDLPGHGIFPTYFLEVALSFDVDDTTTTYNTQDNPGGFMGDNPDGGTYYVAFNFEDAFLSGDYALHFDLYNTQLKTKQSLTDEDIYLFAPFSHDAQTVPEAGTLVLLGIGMLGVAAYRRKMK